MLSNIIRKAAIVLMTVITIVSVLCIMGCSTQCYDKYAMIVDVNQSTVTAIDEDGQVWEFYGDGYRQNKRIMLKIDSNQTATVTDDIVKNAEIIN